MRFDIDNADQRLRRQRPSPPRRDDPPTARRPRRQRLDASAPPEYQRTVVDVRRAPEPPSRPARRRRQVPVLADPSPSRAVRDLFDDDAAEMMNHHHEAGRTDPGEDRVDLAEHRSDPGELPRLVRGSILIRNSIDTAGTPRHVDVVTLDDERGPRGGAASFVVEDNANMFHGLYRTSRENPIYLSDPEASPDDDEVRAAVVNSRTYLTAATTAAAAGSRRDAAGGAAVIVDDFDRDVQIGRATRPGTYTHTHTHSFNGPFSGTTQVSK